MMNWKILKNENDFDEWKSLAICTGDVAEEPDQYPCIARTVVKNWNHQEEEAKYLYRTDILAILDDFDDE